MIKKYVASICMLCCAFFVTTAVWAKPADDQNSEALSETTQSSSEETLNKILAGMPKISGYVQTGYTWGDKNGGDQSSFQMKRMRMFVDKKISNVFDMRAQFEVFSGSLDGNTGKRVMTIMDVFVNAHICKELHFRVGQYYLPLGFENYDISPATLETVDFSNINLRMVCRNAVSTPNLIDYGRDIGVMAYGDLIEDKEKGFSYLSYNLSLTNGYLPTLTDDNKSKDFVGRITVRPIEKLRIMGSYNWGESSGIYQEENPVTGNIQIVPKKYMQMNRVIAGAWYYDPNGLTLRGEYGHIKSSKANVKEEGIYVLAGHRFGQFLPMVRWDRYRDMTHETTINNRDNLLIGCTFEVVKNVKFQLAYTRSVYTDKVIDAGVRSKDGNSLQIMCLAHF